MTYEVWRHAADYGWHWGTGDPHQLTEVGLTWWIDDAGPVYGTHDAIRRRIEQGPPRIESHWKGRP